MKQRPTEPEPPQRALTAVEPEPGLRDGLGAPYRGWPALLDHAPAGGSQPPATPAQCPFWCVQRSGEFLYLPSGWHHATVNLSRHTVGVAHVEPLRARWLNGSGYNHRGQVVDLRARRTRNQQSRGAMG